MCFQKFVPQWRIWELSTIRESIRGNSRWPLFLVLKLWHLVTNRKWESNLKISSLKTSFNWVKFKKHQGVSAWHLVFPFLLHRSLYPERTLQAHFFGNIRQILWGCELKNSLLSFHMHLWATADFGFSSTSFWADVALVHVDPRLLQATLSLFHRWKEGLRVEGMEAQPLEADLQNWHIIASTSQSKW